MIHRYTFYCCSLLAGLLAAAGPAVAQAPVITGLTPLANAVATSPTQPVVVTFSQPLTAGAGSALKVFSSQRGGLRTQGATPAVVAANTLRYTPQPYGFGAGETVQYTATTAASGSGGALAKPLVGQFTVAT